MTCRLRIAITLTAGAFAIAVVAATTSGLPQPASAFRLDLETLRTTANLPAVGGAWFRSEETVEIAATGVRRLGDAAAVTPNDLWHIGSITKSFTSALVATFVERGDLAWTSTLGELIGAERARRFASVTLLDLLSHRAGLAPNLPPAVRMELARSPAPITEQRQRVIDAMLGGEPASAPGEAFVYSNAGYIVVGAILEARTRRSWEELIGAEVFLPLGLGSAGFGAPGAPETLLHPRGHRQQPGAGLVPVEPGPGGDNPRFLGPAGTVHMTIADLARWGRAHLGGERGQDGLLRAATFRRLHEPPRAGATYALGWVVRKDGNRRTIWHNGSNTLWYAVVSFDPDADVGVVLVTNGSIGAARAIDAKAAEMLRNRAGATAREGSLRR